MLLLRLPPFFAAQMNYHIEHHMYAAVPCYRLAALHAAIKYDLPPTPRGLAEVWAIIRADLREQAANSAYVQPIRLPSAAAAVRKSR